MSGTYERAFECVHDSQICNQQRALTGQCTLAASDRARLTAAVKQCLRQGTAVVAALRMKCTEVSAVPIQLIV